MKKKIKILYLIFSILFVLSSCTENAKETSSYINNETTTTKNETTNNLNQESSTIETTTKKEEPTKSNVITINTDDLVKIMPEYKTVLYSVASMRKYDQKDLEKAYAQIVNVINAKVLSYNERIIAQQNYGVLDELVIKETMNLERTVAYRTLPKTDYIDYLNEKDYIDSETKQNYFLLTLDFTTINTTDFYYEYDGYFKRPVTISKDIIDYLNAIEEEDDRKVVIEYPDKYGKLKPTLMYFDGHDGFLYYTGAETQANMIEINIRPLNSREYVFYEDDERRVEIIDKTFKVKVLKDANIGIGQSYLAMAQSVYDYIDGFDDLKFFYHLENLYQDMLDGSYPTPFDKIVLFNANLYKYDERGYITDIYQIVQED